MLQQILGRSDRLCQIVRGNIRRHTDGDSRGTIDKQLRESSRQHFGLHELVVVVGNEIDRVFIKGGNQVQCSRSHASFRITCCCRTIIERTKVTVPINEWNTKIEGLCESNECVINRGITVRVKLTHDLADHALGLHMTTIRTQTHLVHLKEDATLDRLEAVSRIRKCTRMDNGDGIFEEGTPHF